MKSAFLGARVRATLAGHSRRVSSVALTPDGRIGMTAGLERTGALSGNEDRTIGLWDLDSGQRVCTEPATGWVLSVSLSAASFALAGSYDRKAVLFQLDFGPARG